MDKDKDTHLWRDLTAFWIMGLCNNFGYVVMLSAAHDIIEEFNPAKESRSNSIDPLNDRECNILSTGTILLADIIPSMVVKLLAPFIPFWVNLRIFIAIAFAAAGFLLVAFAGSEWVAILGVASTSASCGLGETTCLGYSGRFNRNVISTWSSGTGGAGLIGALAYAGLIALGLSPKSTLLSMLIFPLIEGVAFWGLLRNPNEEMPLYIATSNQEIHIERFNDKLRYALTVMKYMAPLTAVYFLEYFINQGLFELVYFKDIFLDKHSQYRWLNVNYQLGVFISRSSVNLITIDNIWLMSFFQLINVLYFLTEVLFYYTPSIWITFAIVLWEGLLGGGAYVNTFYKMGNEIPLDRRELAMGIVAQSDSYGIALAGLVAIPVHNGICRTAAPKRMFSF